MWYHEGSENFPSWGRPITKPSGHWRTRKKDHWRKLFLAREWGHVGWSELAQRKCKSGIWSFVIFFDLHIFFIPLFPPRLTVPFYAVFFLLLSTMRTFAFETVRRLFIFGGCDSFAIVLWYWMLERWLRGLFDTSLEKNRCRWFFKCFIFLLTKSCKIFALRLCSLYDILLSI